MISTHTIRIKDSGTQFYNPATGLWYKDFMMSQEIDHTDYVTYDKNGNVIVDTDEYKQIFNTPLTGSLPDINEFNKEVDTEIRTLV